MWLSCPEIGPPRCVHAVRRVAADLALDVAPSVRSASIPAPSPGVPSGARAPRSDAGAERLGHLATGDDEVSPHQIRGTLGVALRDRLGDALMRF